MKRIVGMTGVLILAAVLAGCGKGNGETQAARDSGAKVLRIAVVCSAAGQNDNGYNQSAIEGARAVAAELKAECNILEPINGVPAALELLGEEGYNLVFSLEYDFDALIKGVGGAKPIAVQYPNTWYVIFNDNPNTDASGNPIHKNVISVLFDVHEGSFLAGYLSVLVNENAGTLFGDGYNFVPPSQARAVGFIGGTQSNGITVFSYGFIEGINHAAAELGVSYDYFAKYDAGFGDPALGSNVAGSYYNNGANVVYGVAGVVGDGITAKAKEAGRLAIQVDANKDNQQPGYVLTSVMKNTNVPVSVITRALADGSIGNMNNLQTYDLGSGATGITDLSEISRAIKDEAKWNELTGKLKDVAKDIASGKIKIVNAQIGEIFNPAGCPNVRIR
ncbi:MAG: BMP family ABC transporter substrate-binding protein [Spirochaetaceae bacterium]|jgi:basic membrane protein A|nr:BMP family ABC transporter substrate-binding protein [Spirochaetaceae bacterium]